MNVISIDTETPKFDKKEIWRGTPYGDPRDIVCWSWTEQNKGFAEMGFDVADAQTTIDKAHLVVFFNGKHDVAWMRKHGISFNKARVWDVQLGEFILGRQLNKFPSLNDTCLKYGLPTKLDVVKTEYWEKGIDTCDVPPDVLLPYAALDPELTLKCYYKQLELLTPAQRTLVSLMSQDMLVLQEMEQNGLLYNQPLCEERSKTIEVEINSLTEQLSQVYPNTPLNFASNDHLSAFLYGGTIKEDIKIFDGFYKSGIKKDQPKYKNGVKEHILPQLFKPLENTELMKEGMYETNEGTLKKLKGKNKPILEKLLRLAKLEKIKGTYYDGLRKLNEAMHWENGVLHPQYNQTLAATGRLSSSKPNGQNMSSDILDIFVSRYA